MEATYPPVPDQTKARPVAPPPAPGRLPTEREWLTRDPAPLLLDDHARWRTLLGAVYDEWGDCPLLYGLRQLREQGARLGPKGGKRIQPRLIEQDGVGWADEAAFQADATVFLGEFQADLKVALKVVS